MAGTGKGMDENGGKEQTSGKKGEELE